MKNNILSRMISVGILAIIAACADHISHVNAVLMGRDAYLAKQATRYDRNFAHSHSIIITIIACFFLIGISIAVYELIVFVVLKILEKVNAANTNS